MIVPFPEILIFPVTGSMNFDVGLKYRMILVPPTLAVCLFRSIVRFPAGIWLKNIDCPLNAYVWLLTLLESLRVI